MRYGKSSFIITVHVISIRVHFSALIIDTPATFGLATPTKHGWPLIYRKARNFRGIQIFMDFAGVFPRRLNISPFTYKLCGN